MLSFDTSDSKVKKLIFIRTLKIKDRKVYTVFSHITDTLSGHLRPNSGQIFFHWLFPSLSLLTKFPKGKHSISENSN